MDCSRSWCSKYPRGKISIENSTGPSMEIGIHSYLPSQSLLYLSNLSSSSWIDSSDDGKRSSYLAYHGTNYLQSWMLRIVKTGSGLQLPDQVHQSFWMSWHMVIHWRAHWSLWRVQGRYWTWKKKRMMRLIDRSSTSDKSEKEIYSDDFMTRFFSFSWCGVSRNSLIYWRARWPLWKVQERCWGLSIYQIKSSKILLKTINLRQMAIQPLVILCCRPFFLFEWVE